MYKRITYYLIVAYTGMILTQCSKPLEHGTPEHIKNVTSLVDNNRLINADDTPEDWLSYGRNYQEDRFSELNQINKSNISELGLAWSINLGTSRGIESTPLVVDGIMYLTGPWSIVYAIDVRKGEIIWIFDPEVPKEFGEKACCDVVNRGLSIYKGHIFVGSLDGRLISVDAATGKKVWEVITVDQRQGYTITGATRVFDGKVLIGNGGAEYGVRGYVTAYDALNGALLWRFYTVPGNPADGFESQAIEDAAKTWTGEWWKYGGGGTAWDAMAYDSELNLIYVGVGNGAPWDRNIRSPQGGDNLYLSSIVALNAEDGELVWYYQTTPGDSWDYTATQHIILADLNIQGKERKVLMQAPKNGFFYVLDRVTGEFISAEPYVYVNWATEIDYSTGRPIETQHARYTDVRARIAPSVFGGHSWQPMAYNKENGLVYIPAMERSGTFRPTIEYEFIDDGKTWNNVGKVRDESADFVDDPRANNNFGKLIAWDPIKQKEVWSVKHLTRWNGGVLSTGELVFQGDAHGKFRAFDASTGEVYWSFEVGSGIIAAPCTYMVDDIQYVSIAVGWGGVSGQGRIYTEQNHPGTIYTFALDKNEKKPVYETFIPAQIADIGFTATNEEVKHGQQLFGRYCQRCHGGVSSDIKRRVIPNLKYSRPEVFDAFHQIVGNGIFLGKGMPSFGDRLSEQDIKDLKYYILSETKKQRELLLGFERVGLIGDALPTGWENSVPLNKSKYIEASWEAELKLEQGQVKFIADDDWGFNWGAKKFPKGYLRQDGDSIPVQKGTYLVTINLITSEFNFKEVSN